jgi:hypothetical protein
VPKRKLENGEQRLARQNHQSSPEIPEFASQRLVRTSITRGNVGSSRTAGNRIGETALAGFSGCSGDCLHGGDHRLRHGDDLLHHGAARRHDVLEIGAAAVVVGAVAVELLEVVAGGERRAVGGEYDRADAGIVGDGGQSVAKRLKSTRNSLSEAMLYSRFVNLGAPHAHPVTKIKMPRLRQSGPKGPMPLTQTPGDGPRGALGQLTISQFPPHQNGYACRQLPVGFCAFAGG